MRTAQLTAQNFVHAEYRKARAKFQVFRAILPTGFIEKLRRFAQCSDSETLKGFFMIALTIYRLEISYTFR